MAIYDCFTFFNEFELLELRLKILDEIIDYFIIVESDKTHRGFSKSFNFKEREKEFEKYKNKIRYIQVSDVPECSGDGDWSIENFQRNCILRGLYDCKASDLIIISDLDEIPNPKIIQSWNKNQLNIKLLGHDVLICGIRKRIEKYCNLFKFLELTFWKIDNSKFLKKSAVVLEQDFYYYFLNCRSRGKWYGSVITLYENLIQPQKLRDERNYLPRIENGGWHFSYLGGVEKIKIKLNSIVDGNPDLALDDHIKNCIKKGKDLYGRKGRREYDFIQIDQIGVPRINEFVEKYPYLYQDVIG